MVPCCASLREMLRESIASTISSLSLSQCPQIAIRNEVTCGRAKCRNFSSRAFAVFASDLALFSIEICSRTRGSKPHAEYPPGGPNTARSIHLVLHGHSHSSRSPAVDYRSFRAALASFSAIGGERYATNFNESAGAAPSPRLQERRRRRGGDAHLTHTNHGSPPPAEVNGPRPPRKRRRSALGPRDTRISRSAWSGGSYT